MPMDKDYLEHYGVLGMRWGTRRGQLTRKNTMLNRKRQSSLDKKELSRLENKKGFRSSHQKSLDQKKIDILKKSSKIPSDWKKAGIKSYEDYQRRERAEEWLGSKGRSTRGLTKKKLKIVEKEMAADLEKSKKQVAGALLLVGAVGVSALIGKKLGF